MSSSPRNGSWTYGEYLQLPELLNLQAEERGISNDELHFIIVHQTFELWFKQIICELGLVRDILTQEKVLESDIPKACDHLGRTSEIFRLMANQWSVLETLTPQGFLAFRDGLGTASGFESYQMREFELLLGLKQEDRLHKMDVIEQFRKLAKNSEHDAAIFARLEAIQAQPSLFESLLKWIERTPIMGSSDGDEGDELVVSDYVENHLNGHRAVCDSAIDRLGEQGADHAEAAVARFDAAQIAADNFLRPNGEVNRARAGLLFIESYRELPLLTWPRKMIDTMVELEELIVKWRHSHARMVERIMGKRMGTGGSSGVDYLDDTAKYRIFKDLWAVRTILITPQHRPELLNGEFYHFNVEN